MRANTSYNNYLNDKANNVINSGDSIHEYNSTKLRPDEMAKIEQLRSLTNSVQPVNPKDSLSGSIDLAALKEHLNITNSLIISNSQILVHDMGNGKVVPMPLN